MMYCSNCGKEVSDNARFCMCCGCRISTGQSMTPDHSAYQMEQNVSVESKNGTNRRLHIDHGVIKYGKYKIGHVFYMAALIFVIVAVFVISGIYKKSRSNKYNDAIAAYKNNDMDKAERLFDRLGDYKYAKDYKILVELRQKYDELTIEKLSSADNIRGMADKLEDFDDSIYFKNRVNASYEAYDLIQVGKYQEAYASLREYSGDINTFEADLYSQIFFDTFSLVETKRFMWEHLGEDVNNIEKSIRLKWAVSYDESYNATIGIKIEYGGREYQLICNTNLEYSAYSKDDERLDSLVDDFIDNLSELDLYGNNKKECLISTSRYLCDDEIKNAFSLGEISDIPIGKYYYNDKKNNNQIKEGR